MAEGAALALEISGADILDINMGCPVGKIVKAGDGSALMKDPELAGMGTTCEFVFVKDTTVHVVHVGDSRTYAIRGGKIKQLTEDHSVVQEMVRRGELT